MNISVQPLIFSKHMGIQCQKCGNTVSTGNIIVLSAEKGQITGFFPETSLKCCGEDMDGPKLFQTLEEAQEFIKTAKDKDGFLTLSPAEPDLRELLEFFGSTLEEAQQLFTEAIRLGGTGQKLILHSLHTSLSSKSLGDFLYLRKFFGILAKTPGLTYHQYVCDRISSGDIILCMGEAETILRKKILVSKIQSAIMGTIGASGIIALAIIAPNVFKILKYGNLDKKLYKRTFSVNRSIGRLIDRDLIRFVEGHHKKFIVLTDKGKQYLSDTINKKDILKKKKWDKKWRMVIFDIREDKKVLRNKLRSTLVSIGFYKLQHSVWVYPHDCEDFIKLVKADLEIGKEILYVIADHIEYDRPIREFFGIKQK